MSQIENLSLNQTSEHERELTITVKKEFVEQKFNSMLKDLQKKATRPGFRPGKVPFSMVKEMFQHKIVPDLMEKLVKDTLALACEEQNLTPVSRPVYEPVGDFSHDNSFTYKAIFQVRPQLDVQNFENLSIELIEHTFEDKDVDQEIENLREYHATFVAPSDRVIVGPNDLVVCDTSLKVDGEIHKKYSHENYELGMFHPALPEHLKVLVGKNIGDTVEIEHKEDLGIPEIKDKQCFLVITVKQIKERILPNLDDEFAKDISAKFNTLQELRDSLVAQFNITKKRRDQYSKKSAITKTLMEQNDFSVPEGLIEQVAVSLINEEAKKMPKEQRDKILKDHWNEIWESNKKQAEHIAKSELIYENLITKLSIDASEDEIDDIIKLNKSLSREDAKFNVKINKLMDYVASKSNITKTQKSLFDNKGE